MGVRPIHVHLLEKSELGAEFVPDKFNDMLVSVVFLVEELVARESQYF